MPDKELREIFASWAAPFGQAPPPDVAVIRRRVRRRNVRRLAGIAVAVAATCGVTAAVLASVPSARLSPSPVTRKTGPAHRTAGRPPVSAAPYFVSSGRGDVATVRRTATGATIATVSLRAGATIAGLAGARDDRTFVLAALNPSHNSYSFYRLRLNGRGRPGRPTVLAVSPLPSHFGRCPAEVAGLAVSPDAGLLAISLLSNCPNGRAGPGEILTVRLGSGHIVATFRPGDGYPMWLSWTAKGSLAYSWTGTGTGIFLIPDATDPGSAPRLLISSSASVGGYHGADYPLITPDGSAVIVTVARGSFTFAIAEFAVHGKARRLLTPPVRNPLQFCGPLWTDASGRRLLTGCGDRSEDEIQGNQLTKLRRPWQLPAYSIPGAPLIAW